ncbi:REP element-mobilizing transposase RayT [Bibersteinia trehalosi]|uniref:transposase n=1 Tax=Bibersteinia trehalosi TaxID=47735 RepID=UPI00104779FA|nr:transposase [Bibersteinia trehalosi]TCT18665.1 REP element-mobilizing transposase RayT [Bibersteinia trehalosi]
MKPTRKSIRVKWDNYQNGSYFITICTQHKLHYFGEISYDGMTLSILGNKLKNIIIETSKYTRQFIEIPIYTIMPNHLHLIITLNTDFDISQHYFQSNTHNIGSIVRGIKSALTSFARQHDLDFAWQRGYHDRIIRNQKEFEHIYQYIENNVINWQQDCFYPDNPNPKF